MYVQKTLYLGVTTYFGPEGPKPWTKNVGIQNLQIAENVNE